MRSEFRYALSGVAPLRSIACTCWRMGRPWAWRKLPTAIPTGLVSVVGPGHGCALVVGRANMVGDRDVWAVPAFDGDVRAPVSAA